MAHLAVALLAAFTPFRDTHHQAWNPRVEDQAKAYRTIKGVAGEDQARAHLDGFTGLGISPLLDDGTCQWGTLDADDLDARLMGPEDFPPLIEQAKLPLIACATKSGDAHLHLFLNEPIPAQDMREVLRGCAQEMGLFDLPGPEVEVFPKGKRPGPKGYSPGVNLPYFNWLGPDGTVRHGFTPGGDPMPIEGFLSTVDRLRCSPEDLPRKPEDAPLYERPGANGSRPNQGAAEAALEQLIGGIWVDWNGQNAHHQLALGVAGWLAKSGMPGGDIEALIARVCAVAGDAEVDDRVRAARDSVQAGYRAAGRKKVTEICGDAVAKNLAKHIKTWRQSIGIEKANQQAKVNKKELVGSALPAPSNNGNGEHPPEQYTEEGEAPLERRPAVHVIGEYLQDRLDGLPGPRLVWRDGEKAYSKRYGRTIGPGSMADSYSLEIFARLLTDATELSVASLSPSPLEQEKASLSVWRRWVKPAFQEALNHLPNRAKDDSGVTSEEKHEITVSFEQVLTQQVRINTSHEEIPIVTSILQAAIECAEPKKWVQVGRLGAYTRKGPQVAVRPDLLRASKDPIWRKLKPKSIAKELSLRGVASSQSIRTPEGVARAYVVKKEWLEEAFGVVLQEQDPNEQARLFEEHLARSGQKGGTISTESGIETAVETDLGDSFEPDEGDTSFTFGGDDGS